jgi:alkylhydroperoxidase family enzyme
VPRVKPLEPPYSAEVEQALRKWMPPDVAQEPLVLFRLLHHHLDLAGRMRVTGAGLLAHGQLPALDREIVIARVCARAGCRYEWGVHAAVYAREVSLTLEQLTATVSGGPDAPAWSPGQRTLIQAVDELHDTAHLSDETWSALQSRYAVPQLVELLVLAGWYRMISYVANGLLIEDEPWADLRAWPGV